MLRVVLLIPLTFVLLTAGSFAATTYVVDPDHSQIHFSVAHLMVFKVRGNFNEFAATVDVDPEKQTLTATSATIKTDSINTRNQKRDEHLRSADFFETAKFPAMTFVSKTVSGSGDNIQVVGDLTIRGITREVTLNGSFVGAATDPMGNSRAGFEATGQVDRKDFGLNWNKALEAGGFVVGDIIDIGLEIAAVEQ